MLAALTRIQARAAILLIAVLAAASLMVAPPDAGPAIKSADIYSDVMLYTDIGNAVMHGEGYYHAATRLQRAHGFPTSPFVTVRLPTLAWIEAALGWRVSHLVLCTLLAAAAVAWFAMLRGLAGPVAGIAALLLALAGGAMAASPGFVVSHELWAGMLLSLALALRVQGAWLPALIFAGCAMAIRELALPVAAIVALWSLYEGKRGQCAAWLALIAVYGAVLLLHRHMVMELSLPTDPLSRGWNGMRGPGAVLQDIAEVTLLHLIPAPWSYLAVLLALIGFLGAPPALGRLVLPWVAIIAILLTFFARPVNFYWAALTVPMVAVGFVFLPQLVRDLALALQRR